MPIAFQYYNVGYSHNRVIFLIMTINLRYVIFLFVLMFFLNGVESRISSISFNTDLSSDPQKSTFRENYLKISVNSKNELFANITYCFRWQLKNWLPQCLFREVSIGFFLSNPQGRFGFIFINGLEFMFKLRHDMTPYLWYNVCVAHASSRNVIKIFVNGENIMVKTLDAMSNIETKEIRINSNMILGNCRELLSDDPHKKIARVKLQDFNMWSTFLPDEDMLEFTGLCKNPKNTSKKNIAEPQLVNWKVLNVLMLGKSTIENGYITNDVLCGKMMSKVVLMMPIMKSYERAKTSCETFGGRMVFLKGKEMLEELKGNSSQKHF